MGRKEREGKGRKEGNGGGYRSSIKVEGSITNIVKFREDMSKNIRGFSSQWIGCQEINTIQTLFGFSSVRVCGWGIQQGKGR